MMRPGWRSKPIMWRRFQPIRERAQSIRAKIHLTLASIVNFQKWHRLLEPESIWNYSWQWWKCYFLWIRKNDFFFRVANLIFRNTFYLISWILKIMKKHETEKLSEEILIKNFHFELYIWEQKRLKLTILCMTYCSEPTDSACCLEWQSAPKSVIAYAF